MGILLGVDFSFHVAFGEKALGHIICFGLVIVTIPDELPPVYLIAPSLTQKGILYLYSSCL